VLELATGGANFNTATEKLRNGPTRRFKHGPSPIYKLGHYGIGVPRAKYKETMDWYRSVLNLKPTDAIFDPKTDDEITCFNHIDLGEEFTDHHVSDNKHFFSEQIFTSDSILLTLFNSVGILYWLICDFDCGISPSL
jgi:hypothetical protein